MTGLLGATAEAAWLLRWPLLALAVLVALALLLDHSRPTHHDQDRP